MSADDIVFVLRTKGQNGNEAEYRVAHAYLGAMDRIFEDADYPSVDRPLANRSEMLYVFRKAEVFTDAWQAMKSAASWTDAEYGIKIIDLYSIHFPASVKKRRNRGFWRRPRPEQQSPNCW